MDISGCLLIHLKCRVSICEQYLFVLDGDHVLFHQDMIIASAVNFNVVGTQIDTECVACQNDNPFLNVKLHRLTACGGFSAMPSGFPLCFVKPVRFLEADISVIADDHVVKQRDTNLLS